MDFPQTLCGERPLFPRHPHHPGRRSAGVWKAAAPNRPPAPSHTPWKTLRVSHSHRPPRRRGEQRGRLHSSNCRRRTEIVDASQLPRYHEPLRLPQRPKADHFRPPGWWTRPTTAVDLARCLKDLVRMLTPLPRLERTSSRVGCSPALRRPSPSGRRVGSSEELSRPAQGSTSFRPAHLHLGCAKDFPGGSSGRSLASTAPVATGRTDNSPDGTYTRWPSRPRRSLRKLNSAHFRSPFVPHCQPTR